jgi:hypothetical protein
VRVVAVIRAPAPPEHPARRGMAPAPSDRRAVARAQLIEGIGDGELDRRLGSRWVRWADTFGLRQPASLGRPTVEVAALHGCPELTRGEDAIDVATWAGSVPAVSGIAPRVRLGRSRWFNLLWLLPIGFVVLISG